MKKPVTPSSGRPLSHSIPSAPNGNLPTLHALSEPVGTFLFGADLFEPRPMACAGQIVVSHLVAHPFVHVPYCLGLIGSKKYDIVRSLPFPPLFLHHIAPLPRDCFFWDKSFTVTKLALGTVSLKRGSSFHQYISYHFRSLFT
jgi:hypothetical protein